MKTLRLFPYDSTLYVIHPKDARRMERKLKLPHGELFLKQCHAAVTVTLTSKAGAIVFVVITDAEEPVSVGTAAHEALHVIMHLSDHISSEFDGDNAEPWCYLIEHVTEAIYFHDKKVNKK